MIGINQFLLGVSIFGLSCATFAGDDSLLSCLLEPSSETQLSSPVSGVVASVNTERGAQVEKGQLLVALESDLDRASLDSAKARAEFAARKLKRNHDLLEQGLLSDYERDELMTEHQLALLQVNEVRARLKQRQIRSPITGVVVKRHVSVGEYVGSDPIMELVALNPLHAEVVMRSDRYGQIDEGMPMVVLVADPANPGGPPIRHSGNITIVDRVIDAASSTFGFRIKIDNPELALPAGLKCEITFE